MIKRVFLIAILCLALDPDGFLEGQTLKVLTLNVWSGLNYRGVTSVGEFETDSVRERRLIALLNELQMARPDLILLQECNPVGTVASFLSENLGYDAVWQRANGGIKIGSFGIPVNLNEGLAILARKDLQLTFVDVWPLSRRFGLFGDALSFHVGDQTIALIGKITLQGKAVYVANVHLRSIVPDVPHARSMLETILNENAISTAEREKTLADFSERALAKKMELERLREKLKTDLADEPVILGGDFNMDKEEMESIDKGWTEIIPTDTPATWDPVRNPNIRFSMEARERADPLEMLNAWYDGTPRRIDRIFLGNVDPAAVKSAGLFGNPPREGLFLSDHFGVVAEFALESIRNGGMKSLARNETSLDFLPILSYDTDVGFGYGGKVFFLNYLDMSESFDVIVFNSTKGEKWYRCVFSLPDMELRQGTVYPFSLDVVVDYDKYLVSNFYGIGRASCVSDREVYTKEPLEIQMVAGRGFSDRFVGQIGLRFKAVHSAGYDPSGMFGTMLPAVNRGTSSGLRVFSSFRFDSRNSFINPSGGNVVQCDLEAGSRVASDYGITSAVISLQTYHVLFYPKTVLAARLMGQVVTGSNLPVHTYASLGGNRTLRGYPQDRFLDKSMVLANAEIRFPLIRRLDALVFLDAGQVGADMGEFQLTHGWKNSVGGGLRLVLDTFIVRADQGFSDEGSGFYLNFGHIF